MVRKLNSFLVRNILRFVKPNDKYFVFESDIHHIFDNSYYLYMHLTIYKRLHLFYVVYNKKEFYEAKRKGIKRSNILLISNRINVHKSSNLFYIVKWKLILKKCKTCFISYRNFYKEYNIRFYDNQVMVNLRHGQFPIKNVYDYYKGLCFTGNNNMFFRVGTEESLRLLPQEYKKLNCKWFVSPMPRLDSLKEDKYNCFCNLIGISKTEQHNIKYALLMTTLRHVDGSYFETQFPFKVTKEDLEKLDCYLGNKNILLLIKIHHDVRFSLMDYECKYKNILFIDDNDLSSNNLFINNLFTYVNGLLTDYSSAFFDYLYLDKPIGFLIDESMMRTRSNLTSLDPKEYICGPKINNLNRLFDFFDDIASSKDNYKELRDIVFKRFNGNIQDNYSHNLAVQFVNYKYLK